MLKEFLERNEVTELCDLRSRFGIMAYHGGNLERTTDAVAAAVAERTNSSLYAILQASPHRHHLTSTAIDPAHSEALGRFLEHVEVVITIHGFGRRRLWRHLLLGGRNRPLARHVATHLRSGLSRRYRVVDDLAEIPNELRGQHPRNPVNRPPAAGVQIELPPTIRWNFAEWGWSDHRGISRTPEVERLIDALSAAVSSWSVDLDSADLQQARAQRSPDPSQRSIAPSHQIHERSDARARAVSFDERHGE